MKRLFWISALVWISVECSLAQSNLTPSKTKMKWSDARLETVPEPARIRKNPFEGNARDAIAGGKLFEEHCADCHGPKAGGTRRGPSLLRQPVQAASPGALFWVLTNGAVRHEMPVWSKLPEPERWQIVTFLKSLVPEPVPVQPRAAAHDGDASEPSR